MYVVGIYLCIIHIDTSETCSWKKNWCWPGNCANHLPSTCTCSTGFRDGASGYCECKLYMYNACLI